MASRNVGVGVIGSGFMGKAHSLAYRSVGGVFQMPIEPELETIADPHVQVVSITASIT